jgi:hypothetical protein
LNPPVKEALLLKASLFPFFFALFNVTAAIAQFIIAESVIFKIRQNIPGGCFRNVAERFLCQKRLMRGHNDIGHGNQTGQKVIIQDMSGTVLKENVRLFLIYVEARCPDLSGFNPLKKRLRINQAAS